MNFKFSRRIKGDPFDRHKVKSLKLYNNEMPHSLNSPAVIFKDGTRMWYNMGILHREDGPARIFPNGRKEYWLRGKLIIKKEYLARAYDSKLRKRLNKHGSKKDI